MDFGKITDRDNAEAGTFCHFWHPTPDDPMMDGDKAVGCMVRGMESFTVRKAMTRLARGGKGQAGVELIKALVINFVNVERNGAPLSTSDEDIQWLLDRSAKFERQIIEAAEAMGNEPAGKPKP